METEWCVILEKNVRCCKNQCLLQNVPNFVTVNYYKALISHHCCSPVNQFHQLIRLFCNILTTYRAYILSTKYRLHLMLKYNYWLKYNSSLNSHYKWITKVLKNKTKSNKYQQHISFWLALSIWQWTRHLVLVLGLIHRIPCPGPSQHNDCRILCFFLKVLYFSVLYLKLILL